VLSGRCQARAPLFISIRHRAGRGLNLKEREKSDPDTRRWIRLTGSREREIREMKETADGRHIWEKGGVGYRIAELLNVQVE
jgi:hypothetical protein